MFQPSRVTFIFLAGLATSSLLYAQTPTAPAVKAKAKVFFKTDPVGATILAGAQKLGVTPLLVELPAGQIDVTFQLGGFEDKTMHLEVLPDVVNRVETTLEGAGVKVEIKTTPPGAYIFIDDKMYMDAEGQPVVTPCFLTLRQVHADTLAVAKSGYADVIRKDVAFKDGSKFELQLPRGNSNLLSASLDCSIPPEMQSQITASSPLDPFRQPHKIKPHKFSGTLPMLVNAIPGWQSTGLELKQGTPLKIIRTGGKWHGSLSNVSDDPKAVTGGGWQFRIGDKIVTHVYTGKYDAVAPENGELFLMAGDCGETSWGAIEVAISVEEALQTAELATINTNFRTVFIPKGTPVSSQTVNMDTIPRCWTSTNIEVTKGTPLRFSIKGTRFGKPLTSMEIKRLTDAGLVLRVGDDPRDPLQPVKFSAPTEAQANGRMYLAPHSGEEWPKSQAWDVQVTIEGNLRLLSAPTPATPLKTGK